MITRSLNIISRVVDILYDPSSNVIVKFFVYLSSVVYCLNGLLFPNDDYESSADVEVKFD